MEFVERKVTRSLRVANCRTVAASPRGNPVWKSGRVKVKRKAASGWPGNVQKCASQECGGRAQDFVGTRYAM
jgi:hypothetical protein